MSFYHMMFQANKETPILLFSLELSPEDFGRYRDIHLSEDGGKIVVTTRLGGNNRSNYKSTYDALKKHPCFESNYDDTFDKTYSYFVFKTPDQFLSRFKELSKTSPTFVPISIKFNELMNDEDAFNKLMKESKGMKQLTDMLKTII